MNKILLGQLSPLALLIAEQVQCFVGALQKFFSWLSISQEEDVVTQIRKAVGNDEHLFRNVWGDT